MGVIKGDTGRSDLNPLMGVLEGDTGSLDYSSYGEMRTPLTHKWERCHLLLRILQLNRVALGFHVLARSRDAVRVQGLGFRVV